MKGEWGMGTKARMGRSAHGGSIEVSSAGMWESLAVYWLGLCAFTARTGSIPGWRTKDPQAIQCSQKKNHKPKNTHKKELNAMSHSRQPAQMGGTDKALITGRDDVSKKGK